MKNPIIGGIPEYLTINTRIKMFKYFLLSKIVNSLTINILNIKSSWALYKYKNHAFCSIDHLTRKSNQVALLIDRNAKVFFRSYKKIK